MAHQKAYPLEPLLRKQGWETDQVQHDLRIAQQIESDLGGQLQVLKMEHKGLHHRLEAMLRETQNLNVERYRQESAYLPIHRQLLDVANSNWQEACDRVERIRKQLMTAYRTQRATEKHKEKFVQESVAHQNKLDLLSADELWLSASVGRKMGRTRDSKHY